MIRLLYEIKHFIKTHKENTLLLLLLVLFNILLIVSFSPCPYENLSKCYIYIKENLTQMIILVVSSFICIETVIIYSTLKKKPIFFIISIINLAIYYLIYSNISLSFQHHEDLNIKILLTLVIVIYFIYLLIKLSIYSLKRRVKYLFFQVTFLIFLLIFHVFYRKILNNSKWNEGFNLTILDNTVGCHVNPPVFNTYNAFDGLFDKTKLYEINCSKDGNYNKEFHMSYYKNSDIVFMKSVKSRLNTERTEESLFNLLMNEENLIFINFTNKSYEINNFSKEKVVSYNKTEIINYYSSLGNEIFIDFTDNSNPRLYQKAFFNKTLAEERKTLYSNQSNSDSSGNVLFIFIDAMSRRYMHMKLPKITSFLEEFYNNSNSQLESFQFFKYNSIQDFTYYVMAGVYFGKDIREFIYKSDSNTDFSHTVTRNLYDIYRDRGYLINFSTNMCSPLMFSYSIHDTFLFKNESIGPHDHENINVFCDPNHVIPNEISISQEFLRCLYSKRTSYYTLDYADQLINQYKDYNQFLTVYIMDAHESTGEVIKYTEDDLYNFLLKNKQTFIDKDWNIIIASDHGMHISPSSNLPFTDVNKEKTLPFLSLLLQRRVSDKYRFNILSYENQLVSNFDIHNIVKYLSGEKDEPTVMSHTLTVFNDTVIERSCGDLNITDTYCRCYYK